MPHAIDATSAQGLLASVAEADRWGDLLLPEELRRRFQQHGLLVREVPARVLKERTQASLKGHLYAVPTQFGEEGP